MRTSGICKTGENRPEEKACFKIYIFLFTERSAARPFENSGNRENAAQKPATGILYKSPRFLYTKKRKAEPENKKELCPEMEKMMRLY